MDRIVALPRRPQEWSDETTREAVDLLTSALKTETGSWTFKPIQARALVEAHDVGALVGEIGAGQGKCLLSLVLPHPLILDAKRTLLLVPAHLRQQTFDEHAKLSKHFKLQPIYDLDAGAVSVPHIRVLSYQSLSTVRFASFLEEFNPDLIIADEAHYLARIKSARGKRLFRFIRQKQRSGAKLVFIPLSGTMRRKSIRECCHIYEAALGPMNPFPNEYPDVEQWRYCLDEGIDEDTRLAPGALAALCTQDEIEAGLDGLRRGVRRRIVESYGVVSTKESGVDVSLVLQARHIDVPQSIQDAMRVLRTKFALPTGETFEGGITAWNHCRECLTGFTYRWDPPAPDEWADARREWNAFVNLAMEHPPTIVRNGEKVKLHLDSPLMVVNAIRAGHFGPPERINPWMNWLEVRDTFEPNPVPYWISDFLIRDAEEWAIKNNGIVWVGHTSAFTKVDGGDADPDKEEEAIGRLFTKIPYFGAGKPGDKIRNYKGPCVASIRAHGTGKNLVQWNRAYIMCLPSSGSSLEQLLARHHRHGQEADEVYVTFPLHGREMAQALFTAQADAKFMQDLSGNEQRILTCSILEADGHSFDPTPYQNRMEQATAADDPMWAKNGKQT